MDIKKLVEEIISGLSDGMPISKILLKCQIVAANIGNGDFKTFIRKEQQGYSYQDKIPDYRVLNTLVKAEVAVPNGYMTIDIPIEIIDASDEEKCLMRQHTLVEPLFQIEDLCNNSNGKDLIVPLPAYAFPLIGTVLHYKNVQKAWQRVPVSAARNIIEIFKSRLLDFLLRLDDELNWDIDFTSADNKKIVQNIVNNVNIKANMVNTGSGTMNTGDIEINEGLASE